MTLNNTPRLAGNTARLIILIGSFFYLLLPFVAVQLTTHPRPKLALAPNLVLSNVNPSGPAYDGSPRPTFPERIIAVEGRPVETAIEFHQLMAEYSDEPALRLTVIGPPQSGLGQRDVSVAMISPERRVFWQEFWLSYVLGTVCLVIALWSLTHDAINPTSQVYAFFCLALAWVLGGNYDAETTQRFEWLYLTARTMVAPLALLVALTIPRRVRTLKDNPRLMQLLFLPGALLLAVYYGSLNLSSDPWLFLQIWPIDYTIIALLVGAAFMALFYQSWLRPEQFVRRQARPLFFAACVGLIPIPFWLLFERSQFLQWNYLAAVFFVLACGYTLVRHRLFDVEVRLRRTLTYGLVAVAFLAVLLMVSDQLLQRLGPGFVESPFPLAFYLLILALLFEPLRRGVQFLVDRYLLFPIVDHTKLFDQYSRDLNRAVNFDDIAAILAPYAQKGLVNGRCAVFLVDPATQGFRPIHGAGKTIAGDDPLVRQLSGGAQLIPSSTRLLPDSEGQTLDATPGAGPSYWAPIALGRQLLGWLAVDPKEAGQPLSRSETRYLAAISERVAIVIEYARINAQLQQRAHQLETLNSVTRTINAVRDPAALLDLILDNTLEVLAAEAGSFFLLHEEASARVFRVVRGPASEQLLGQEVRLGRGLAGSAAQTGQSTIVNNVAGDSRWDSSFEPKGEFDTRSILTVPLQRQEVVIGVLQVINKRNGTPFSEDDRAVLTAFADQAVVALENARLLEQSDTALAERVQELSLLQQLDREVNQTLELASVVDLTLLWVLRVLNTEHGAIVLANDAGDIIAHHERGYTGDLNPVTSDNRTVASGLIRQAMRTQQAITSQPITSADQERFQLTLPIRHQQEALGAVALESWQPFAPHDIALATRVIDHAAAAIANALLVKQLHEANRAKSEFVSMVSHELKSPMTAMYSFVDLLLRESVGPLNDRQRRFLDMSYINLQRMQRLIQDLSLISRLESSQLAVLPQPIALASVVSQALPTVAALCTERRITLHVDVPDSLPFVMGDDIRLVQVLTNLISNAAKYSPEDSPVYVSARLGRVGDPNYEPGQAAIVAQVQDFGYGIDKADQARLFTKFFRSEERAIRQAPGTGLGLAICKGIVELHGGQLWCESALGEGSTFYFSLPEAAEGDMRATDENMAPADQRDLDT